MMKNQQEAREPTVRQQMEAVALLSVGTFLEYFDLMIYVHMAVVINELFFQKLILKLQLFMQQQHFVLLLFLDPLEH
ncbi:putative proline/betaine transporter [Rickettsia hoogstraalii str. RCCE3]|nr:putative proline/betaine transporter [Rickettsia hoogstraalii str. RCCE3]KJV77784.1 putative proline/betaine transporter [Rickettsia hoogstraalii str. RCCE3]